jgi:hypothetical protein
MFIVTNASGERLAAPEHFDEALEMLRLLPDAHEVLRASDGERLAWRRHHTPKRAAFRLTSFEWGMA